MECKKEIKGVLRYTDNGGTQIFSEGDNVICLTEDGQRHIGRIAVIGTYQENEHSERESAVCLDTSKNDISSSEIIKILDIASICRLPVDDVVGYPETNEVLDRDKFIEMIVGLGHDKEKAKIMYDCMKDFIAFYKIPLSRMLSCAIRETDLSADGGVDELVDVSNKLLEVMSEVFQSVTNVIKKARIPGIESQVVM